MEADSYRPICLTSTLCKVLEKVVKHATMDYSQSVNTYDYCRPTLLCAWLLMIREPAFRSRGVDGRSREEEQVDAVRSDFSKAFHKVSHRLLLDCLVRFRIRGDLLTWIEDFLHNRTLCVRINGCHSLTRTAASRVPQGSVLGPMLFISFASEVPLSPEIKVLFYVDDFRIWWTLHTLADRVNFQRDIDCIESWATVMQFHINTTKTVNLHIASMSKDPVYHIDNAALHCRELAHDLGVLTRND